VYAQLTSILPKHKTIRKSHHRICSMNAAKEKEEERHTRICVNTPSGDIPLQVKHDEECVKIGHVKDALVAQEGWSREHIQVFNTQGEAGEPLMDWEPADGIPLYAQQATTPVLMVSENDGSSDVSYLADGMSLEGVFINRWESEGYCVVAKFIKDANGRLSVEYVSRLYIANPNLNSATKYPYPWFMLGLDADAPTNREYARSIFKRHSKPGCIKPSRWGSDICDVYGTLFFYNESTGALLSSTVSVSGSLHDTGRYTQKLLYKPEEDCELELAVSEGNLSVYARTRPDILLSHRALRGDKTEPVGPFETVEQAVIASRYLTGAAVQGTVHRKNRNVHASDVYRFTKDMVHQRMLDVQSSDILEHKVFTDIISKGSCPLSGSAHHHNLSTRKSAYITYVLVSSMYLSLAVDAAVRKSPCLDILVDIVSKIKKPDIDRVLEDQPSPPSMAVRKHNLVCERATFYLEEQLRLWKRFQREYVPSTCMVRGTESSFQSQPDDLVLINCDPERYPYILGSVLFQTDFRPHRVVNLYYNTHYAEFPTEYVQMVVPKPGSNKRTHEHSIVEVLLERPAKKERIVSM
jgi:hypothetical protein